MLRDKYPFFLAIGAVVFSILAYFIFNLLPVVSQPTNQSIQERVSVSQNKPYKQSSAVVANQDKIHLLEKKLASLNAELAKVSDQRTGNSEDEEPRSQLTYHKIKEEPVLTEEQHQQTMNSIKQQRANFEAQLMSEEIDVEWSNETLDKVMTTFRKDELKGLDFIEGNCGSTLCQLEISANAEMSIEESMQRLSVDCPWDGPTFFAADSQGNVTLFFARDGFDLPSDELM